MPYTRLRYHLIIETKYRTPWITPDVEDLLYPAINKSIERLDGMLIRIGGITDHVHIVCAIRPRHSVSNFVGRIKCETSGHLSRTREDLENFCWSDNYGAFTLNPFDMSDVIEYVAHQKHHHATDELLDPYERCDKTHDDAA